MKAAAVSDCRKTECFIAARGSGVFDDLFFLGRAADFRGSSLVRAEKDAGGEGLRLVCGDKYRIHLVVTEGIKIAPGNYYMWKGDIGGAIALIESGKIKIYGEKERGEDFLKYWQSIDDICGYGYRKRIKVDIRSRGGDGFCSGGGAYYSDFLPLLLQMGIGVRLDYLDFLRGREWEACYENACRPVVFTSGARRAVIRPMADI